MRPICKCGARPKAINYKKNGRVFYRSLCEICMSKGMYSGIPRWYRAGYKMKSTCDRCGFHSDLQDVFRVYHIDGDLNNCRFNNLKTVCANCRVILSKEKSGWRQGDLIADY